MKKLRFNFPMIIIYFILFVLAFVCLLPLLNVIAKSLSTNTAVAAGLVVLWPVDFTLESYSFVFRRNDFQLAMLVSLQRIILGGGIALFLCILTAYPLSKESMRFRLRTKYAWFLFFTSLFSGGLIPWYLVIKELHLLNTIWALVLPTAVPIFYVILLLNFFRNVPKELEEASVIDGASQWRILWQVFVPVSLPAIATIIVFVLVDHWNSWFDGIILMNHPNKYPLASYLRSVIFDITVMQNANNDWLAYKAVSDRTLRATQIVLATIPIMLVYPFLQKYFVKGIMIGSIKG